MFLEERSELAGVVDLLVQERKKPKKRKAKVSSIFWFMVYSWMHVSYNSYMAALLWCFVGVAIIADIFMAAIECARSVPRGAFTSIRLVAISP